MKSATVVRTFRLDLDEVSALCLRRRQGATPELLAVGDEAYDVVRAELSGDELVNARSDGVRGLVDTGEGSEWEGIASDGAGRVFVLRESTATVFVFAPDLGSLVHTLQLDARGEPMLEDPNAGPEGLVLLAGGRVLVAKQRDPVMLVELGPPPAKGAASAAGRPLPVDEDFELPAGEQTAIAPLHAWRLSEEDEERVESANDLAFDSRGRLHAISSKSRRIYRLGRLDPGDGEVKVEAAWMLPEELEPGKKRRAEGLTFDDGDRPLVALDAKDEDHNAYLLEPLEDR